MGKVKRRLGGLAHVEEKSKVEKVSEKVEEEEKSVADIHSALLIDLHLSISKSEEEIRRDERRSLNRLIRTLVSYRAAFRGTNEREAGSAAKLLQTLVASIFASTGANHQGIATMMDILKAVTGEAVETEPLQIPITSEVFFEVILLLTAMHLIDLNKYNDAFATLTAIASRVSKANLRSLDLLLARAYYFSVVVAEKLEILPTIRNDLLTSFRTATLRHDIETQAVLYNSLVRLYIVTDNHTLAIKHVSKAVFPETASSHQLARYLFYSGILAVTQESYVKAQGYFDQATRKSPVVGGHGFKVALLKWDAVVTLLRGSLPTRGPFLNPEYRDDLQAYSDLVISVRHGDLLAFNKQVEAHAAVYRRDSLYDHIQKLQFAVVKSGLRKISQVYSKIEIEDVKKMLGLQSTDEAENAILKAIQERVFEGYIDKKESILVTNIDKSHMMAVPDQLQPRIDFCVAIQKEATKSMRYPDKVDKARFETKEERQRSLEEAEKAMKDSDDE